MNKLLTATLLLTAANVVQAATLTLNPSVTEVNVGETLTFSGRIDGIGPVNVALVMDESGSVDSTEFNQQLDYARGIVDELPLSTSEAMTALSLHTSGSRIVMGWTALNSVMTNAFNSISKIGGNSCVSCGLRSAGTLLGLSTRTAPGVGEIVLLFTDSAPGNVFTSDYQPSYTALHSAGAVVLGIALPDINSLAELENATNPPAGFNLPDSYSLAAGIAGPLDAIFALAGYSVVEYSVLSGGNLITGTAAVGPDGSFTLPPIIAQAGDNSLSLMATNYFGNNIGNGAVVFASPVPLPPSLLSMATATLILAGRRHLRLNATENN